MAGRRADEEPLYRALADDIRERIRSGEFAIGAQIPTEHELCAGEGVSRTTVRQAVQALVGEGVLERQQGRGTFVTPRFAHDLGHLRSFASDLAAQGAPVTTRLLDAVFWRVFGLSGRASPALTPATSAST